MAAGPPRPRTLETIPLTARLRLPAARETTDSKRGAPAPTFGASPAHPVTFNHVHVDVSAASRTYPARNRILDSLRPKQNTHQNHPQHRDISSSVYARSPAQSFTKTLGVCCLLHSPPSRQVSHPHAHCVNSTSKASIRAVSPQPLPPPRLSTSPSLTAPPIPSLLPFLFLPDPFSA